METFSPKILQNSRFVDFYINGNFFVEKRTKIPVFVNTFLMGTLI